MAKAYPLPTPTLRNNSWLKILELPGSATKTSQRDASFALEVLDFLGQLIRYFVYGHDPSKFNGHLL
ncbi:hypothetical protein QQ045_002916 [Rhodiola kirilowii]